MSELRRIESIYQFEKLDNVKVIESKELSTSDSIRLIVVSKINGDILDTADGWGYKSEEKALAGYKFKSKQFSSDYVPKSKQKSIQPKLIKRQLSIEELNLIEVQKWIMPQYYIDTVPWDD